MTLGKSVYTFKYYTYRLALLTQRHRYLITNMNHKQATRLAPVATSLDYSSF